MSVPYKAPLELYIQGDQVIIRDCEKRTVTEFKFHNMDYWIVKNLKEQIWPLIVNLLNDHAVKSEIQEYASEGIVIDSQDGSKSNGKAHKLSRSEKMKEYWRKRKSNGN